MREFVTGTSGEARPGPLLATVLFSDMVESTTQAGAGSATGRGVSVLDEHDAHRPAPCCQTAIGARS